MLAVTLSKDARARAVQLPAWNEALGLPRPWDQQWSLRAQQILSYESDLLEYADIFKGSEVVAAETERLAESAWAEVEEVLKRGGAVEAVESGYIKQKLVESNAARLRAIESGEQVVVGVNKYIEGASSPLVENLDDAILTVDPAVEEKQIAALGRWKAERDASAVERAIGELQRVARSDENIMPASIAAAHAGVTTGEWAHTLRAVWGEYRAPTGVAGATVKASGSRAAAEVVDRLRKRLGELEVRMGRRPKLLVGKPGLDGHSNGAEQIAIKARDVGFDVVYEGIRVSPEQIVASALEEGVHLIGLSILSGSHLALVPEVLERLREAGLSDIPVVVGGIIPEADAERLRRDGVAAVYTPKDFELDHIMSDLIDLVDRQHAAE
jgi:(2R)-ethylmalonyl-CoA mutase